MEKLHTKTKTFDVDWAAPASITGFISFLAKIHGSDIDTVHNTFKDPEETVLMIKTFTDSESESGEMEVDRYSGYTVYNGFYIDYDGDIVVTINKGSGV